MINTKKYPNQRMGKYSTRANKKMKKVDNNNEEESGNKITLNPEISEIIDACLKALNIQKSMNFEPVYYATKASDNEFKITMVNHFDDSLKDLICGQKNDHEKYDPPSCESIRYKAMDRFLYGQERFERTVRDPGNFLGVLCPQYIEPGYFVVVTKEHVIVTFTSQLGVANSPNLYFYTVSENRLAVWNRAQKTMKIKSGRVLFRDAKRLPFVDQNVFDDLFLVTKPIGYEKPFLYDGNEQIEKVIMAVMYFDEDVPSPKAVFTKIVSKDAPTTVYWRDSSIASRHYIY